MYTQFSQAISDVEDKFEGGVSFNIDWNSLGQEGARSLRKNVSPSSIKRRVPIFGGIATDLPVLTAPDDVHTPAALYPADQIFGGRSFKYLAAQHFFANPDSGMYTLDHVNGVPFIFANIDVGNVMTLLSSAEVDDLTGGVQMASTLRNYIKGTNAMVGSFSDTVYDIAWTLEAVQDLSTYQNGVVVIPFEAGTDVTKIESVALHLASSVGNFFTVTTTADVIGNQFTSGWNLARLDLSVKTKTGTPLIANIASAVLEIKMTSGVTQLVTVDDITLHQTQSAFFEYYSNNNFRSAAGEYLNKPTEDTDEVLFIDEAYDIWIYEVCTLVIQNATYDGVDSKESTRIERKLKDSYDAYLAKFPSMQQPVAYNIASSITL